MRLAVVGPVHMGLLEIIRQAGDGDGGTLYECRDCGATAAPDDDACPNSIQLKLRATRFTESDIA